MARRSVLILAACLALLALALVWQNIVNRQANAGFVLLTAVELSELDLSAPIDKEAKQRSLTLSNANGPTIRIASPSGYALVSPVDFDISLEPKNGVAVDMSSLRIEYKLGPTWVNLTKRIMKQARIKGSRLFARGAELPPGNHTLRLTAKDTDDRVTRATVSFSVSK